MIRKIIHSNAWFLTLWVFWLGVGSILLALYGDEKLFFSINQVHHPFFDRLMTVLSAFGRGDTITLIFVMLLLAPYFRTKAYLLSTLLFGLLTPLINHFSKMFFEEVRPLGIYGIERVHTVPWLENLFNNSFPSGHTMGAFGFCLLIHHLIPQKQWYVSIALFLLAIGCGYSRMYLGQHFFSDVLAGSLIGMLISCLIISTTQIILKNNTTDA
ncbi:MAG: phosphatase PAP2 family protein [Bacteroidetes bacterium]|nr:phosphatase PAP2 family protein [Bacteroidota bacterium]